MIQEFNEILDQLSKSIQGKHLGLNDWEWLLLTSVSFLALGGLPLVVLSGEAFAAMALSGSGFVGLSWGLGMASATGGAVTAAIELASGDSNKDQVPTWAFSLSAGVFAMEFAVIGGLMGGAPGAEKGIYYGNEADVLTQLFLTGRSVLSAEASAFDIADNVAQSYLSVLTKESDPATRRNDDKRMFDAHGPASGSAITSVNKNTTHFTIPSATPKVLPGISFPSFAMPTSESYGHSAPTYGTTPYHEIGAPHDLNTLERSIFAIPLHDTYGNLNRADTSTPEKPPASLPASTASQTQLQQPASQNQIVPPQTQAQSGQPQNTPPPPKNNQLPSPPSQPPQQHLTPASPTQNSSPSPSSVPQPSSSSSQQNPVGVNLTDYLGGTSPSQTEVDDDPPPANGQEDASDITIPLS